MGIFGITESKSEKSILESLESIECNYENIMEATFDNIANSINNHNEIMKAVAFGELSYMSENNGQEFIYEAADIKGFFKKMKELFIKIWQKIKGLFDKFFSTIDSYTRNDKTFVNKYKTKISNADTKGFSYKGYNFTISNLVSDAASKLDAEIKKMDPHPSADESKIKLCENRIEVSDKLRGSVLGQSECSATDFTKELFKKLRDGEDSKKELTNISTDNLIKIISNSAELKKEAKNAYTALQTEIKAAIKVVENTENDLLNSVSDKTNAESISEASKKIKAAHCSVYLLQEKLSILQVVNGQYLTAIKDSNRQAKSICVALMSHNPKKKASDSYQTESTVYSFLNNVELQ